MTSHSIRKCRAGLNISDDFGNDRFESLITGLAFDGI